MEYYAFTTLSCAQLLFRFNMKPLTHQVHRLYDYRKSLSTKTFNARGKNVSRCLQCLQNIKWCLCDYRRQVFSDSAFLLLMYDDEVLKPSNTGRLIADIVPETHALLWTRVDVNPEIIRLISNPDYQPVLIFPDEYAENEVVLHESDSLSFNDKKTLFILLDGTWREAIKMFRKSPYLRDVPILSFSPEFVSEYAIRKGQRDFQLGTAEVAAMALECFGEQDNAETLRQWSNVFKESALLGRNKRPESTLKPFSKYIEQFEMAHESAILHGINSEKP